MLYEIRKGEHKKDPCGPPKKAKRNIYIKLEDVMVIPTLSLF